MKTPCPFLLPLAALLPVGQLAAEPSLTIYNQNFAVVRDTVPLDLKAGVNEARFSGMTAQAETDSVILRDPSGKVKFQILEQAYRNDPVSTALMLQLNEGKTIDFYVREPNKPDRTVQGKIVRSGHGGGQPIIEVDGQLRFSLPGEPIFPSLGDDTILNPTLSWTLNTPEAAKFDAELAYVTGGLSWKSDYNIVAADTGDTIDIVGWVTFNNASGNSFKNAKVKLMAGDVNKVQPPPTPSLAMRRKGANFAAAAEMSEAVTEKAFDEFHLYTIARPVTLRDRETKQVEFIRGMKVKAPKIFVYDGATMSYGAWNYYRGEGEYGVPTNKKVWILREFKNSKDNNLGMALPKGRLRFYSRDDDGSLQFTGENNIDHTAKDETVRVYLGNSFDLVGERRRTAYKVNNGNDWLDETFEIKLRNHKKEAVEIRVVEHLTRYDNWELKEKSDEYRKLDSHTIEFPVTLKPDEEKIVTYQVHYTW